MAAKNLADYYVVRESYSTGDDTVAKGEIIHRRSPAFRAEFATPASENIRHDIEAATAAPGEKRDAKVTE